MGIRPHRTPDTGEHWSLQRALFLMKTATPGVSAVGDVRHGSIKRVASAVGHGSIAIRLIHDYLALAPSLGEGHEPRLQSREHDSPNAFGPDELNALTTSPA